MALILLLPFKAFAHYSLTGFRLVEGEDFIYHYYDCPAQYGSPIPTSWRPFIGLAALTWSSYSSNVDLHSTTSGNASNSIYRANYISEIALADIYYKDGNVFAWVIMFNERENFYPGNKYDVKTVALHEFGHVLGLDDIGFSLLPDTRAHMMYYAYTGIKPLHAHDIEGMQSIYGK